MVGPKRKKKAKVSVKGIKVEAVSNSGEKEAVSEGNVYKPKHMGPKDSVPLCNLNII
jgi:hypothetical protein